MSVKKFGLDESVIQKIQSVLKKNKVEEAIIYGSRAKGNFKPGSDIDMTIVDPDFSISELLAIETQLDDLLLPYKFDLSLFHLIEDENLVEHIQRVGKKI